MARDGKNYNKHSVQRTASLFWHKCTDKHIDLDAQLWLQIQNMNVKNIRIMITMLLLSLYYFYLFKQVNIWGPKVISNGAELYLFYQTGFSKKIFTWLILE